MNNVVILIIAALAVLAIVALVVWMAQRRRSAGLRERFGPEYERTVEGSSTKREAEAELRAREERVDALEIRPLEPVARDRYVERWREVQAMFVDDPGGAVEQADTLIGEVMRARGYPVGDFEQRAADISVNHPHVVDHYRTAHSIAVKRRSGEGATEQLRQAFVHYRALFADLLEVSAPDGTEAPAMAAEQPAPAVTATTAEQPVPAAAPTTDVHEPRTETDVPTQEAVDSTRSAR